jgi:uncharacterized protein YgiM (DUF1202 family)
MAGVLVLFLTSCQSAPERLAPIAEAYVGPAELKIRSDIPTQSAVVATVRQGDRLQIVQRRRRFFRVRTSSGAEGWTDERQLLAAEDMQRLKDLAARAAKMPAQGQATSFGSLNVHTQPARQSPSFLQVKEGDKVDVLEHVTSPRVDLPRKPLVPPPPPKKAAEKRPPKEVKYPPLAAIPKPPGPPPDWLELSKSEPAEEDLLQDEAPAKDEKPANIEKTEKPVATDDWSLIRSSTGQSGWVLTRRLAMAIPDEVAQYAEGRRIVSYFSLGEVADGDQKKRNWLWTTIADGVHPYDFDSFRVFIWSLRRHRYETAYIERNIRGYAPVVIGDVELAAPRGKDVTAASKYPGFSICLEKKDGMRYRRSYAFLTNVVRSAGEQSCEQAPQETVVAQAPLPPGSASPASNESFGRRLRNRWRALTRRWFGG